MMRMTNARWVALRSLSWFATAYSVLASCSDRGDDPTMPEPHAAAEGSESALQGQSGSEAVPNDYNPVSADWVSCPCGMNASAWLEATVVELDGARLELTLESVLHGEVELEIGQSFWGDYDGELLCGGTLCQTLAQGDAVLVGYAPQQPQRPPCAALDDCLEICRAELAANAPGDVPVASTCPMSCEEQTQDDCLDAPPPDPTQARLQVIRWQDPLLLAETAEAEMTLALDDVSLLWAEADECDANWDQSFFELEGYPLPYYSTEAQEVVYFPLQPVCD